MKLIKWIVYLIIFAVLLVIAAGAFIVTKVDPNDYKDKIAEQVKQHTGRSLSIAGDIAWSFYPSLGLDIGQLSLQNQAGFSPELMVSAQSAKVQVAVMPLLEKKIEIGKIDLEQPVLNLSINEQGVANWSDLIKEGAADTSSADDAGAQAGTLLGGLIVKGVNINNGSVSWDDATAQQSIKVTDFNLTTGEIKPGQPVDFDLSAKLDGNVLPESTNLNIGGSLNVSTDLNSVELIGSKVAITMDNIDANVDLGHIKFDSNQASLNAQAVLFSGQYDLIPITGEIERINYHLESGLAEIVSQNYSAELLGTKLLAGIPALSLSVPNETLSAPSVSIQQGEGSIEMSAQVEQLFSDLSASGNIKTNTLKPREMLANLGVDIDGLPNTALQNINLDTDYQFTMDAIKLPNINAVVDQSTISGWFNLDSFSQPAYRYDLDVDTLTVDQYLTEDGQQSAEDAGPAGVVALPFAALKGLNAKGVLKIGTLDYQGLVSNDLVVDADTTQDKINISPLRANLYGGESVNDITYDISGETPKMNFKTSLANINLAPFLQAMQVTDRFEGLGNVKAEVTSFGLTASEFISNMNGEVRVNLDDGAISGANIQNSLINVAKVYKSLKGKNLVSDSKVGDKTEFSNFKALVKVKNGVLVSENIDLQAPALRLKGRGNVNLNTEILDLKMVVAIVDSLEGQGGQSIDELKGEELPLTITGNLAAPKIRIDTAALLKKKFKKELTTKLAEEVGIDLPVNKETGEQVSVEDKLKEKLDEKLDEEKAKLKKKLLKGLFGG